MDDFPDGRIARYGQALSRDQPLDVVEDGDPPVRGDRAWRLPVVTYRDLLRLGVAFIQGRIGSTPWFWGPLHSESGPISELLAQINAAGMLTINGQPGSDERFVCGITNKFTREQQKPYLYAYVTRRCLHGLIEMLERRPVVKFQSMTWRSGRHTMRSNAPFPIDVSRVRDSSVEANVDTKQWRYEGEVPLLDVEDYTDNLRAMARLNPGGARILREQCAYLMVVVDSWGSQELEPFMLRALRTQRYCDLRLPNGPL